jgi:hypothetical protein
VSGHRGGLQDPPLLLRQKRRGVVGWVELLRDPTTLRRSPFARLGLVKSSTQPAAPAATDLYATRHLGSRPVIPITAQWPSRFLAPFPCSIGVKIFAARAQTPCSTAISAAAGLQHRGPQKVIVKRRLRWKTHFGDPHHIISARELLGCARTGRQSQAALLVRAPFATAKAMKPF